MDVVYLIAAAAGVYLLINLYLLAPGRSGKTNWRLFVGRSFAHRGLYKKDQSVPENSLAAFDAAVKAGYGVTLDLRMSYDSELFVFKDVELDRACPSEDWADGLVCKKLTALPLFGTEETIPLLTDVLELVDGKVPILIEVQRSTRDHYLCSKLKKVMEHYEGIWGIMSEDPIVLSWFKRNAPTIFRGQLTNSKKELKKEGASPFPALITSKLLTNYLTRPHFIAHGKGKKSLNVRVCEALGAKIFTYGVIDEKDPIIKKSNALIFEHYLPESHIKSVRK